ncbi:hypothetical protein PHLCEN_2v1148 [Hermanssonia centrifuga]|uniref:Uncharacterized protein n=1 Tax=Hermanssonia centrifuga TaxID=98765 RepID=A0A2R6S406_9APHY|nr:hypothetical protein PHLCEN_2v1148 [Hermanssonia centrifuga]
MTFNPQFSAVEYSGHMQFPRGVWLALTAVYAVSPVVSMPLSLLYSRNADHTLHEISPYVKEQISCLHLLNIYAYRSDRSEDEHFMDTVFQITPGSGPVRKLRELMPTESTGDAANDELPLQTDSLGFSAISSASSNQLTHFGIPATVRLVGTSNGS